MSIFYKYILLVIPSLSRQPIPSPHEELAPSLSTYQSLIFNEQFVCYRLVMAFTLRRDQAWTVPLLSTCGTATLLSRDGEEIKAPLAPLLGASTLVWSILAESHIHPGLHAPLALSFEVAVDVLANVEEILRVGKSNVEEENIEDVREVFDSLGVKADLRQSKRNAEYYEHVTAAVKEEKIELKEEFQSNSDVENYESAADNKNEVKDFNLKQCYVAVENLECSDQRYRSIDKNVSEENVQKFNIYEYSAKYVSDLENHTVGKKYQCTICNFSCPSPSHLKMHFRTHTNEKPYTCQICNVSFSQPSDLRRHRRLHTGEKPYTCQVCDKSFSRRDHLREHSRLHTEEKPYKCKVCSFETRSKSILNGHKLIHSGEKPHKCKICDYSCTQSTTLKLHMIKHTGEAAFKCQLCDYSATTRKKVKKHKKENHDA